MSDGITIRDLRESVQNLENEIESRIRKFESDFGVSITFIAITTESITAESERICKLKISVEI